MANVIKVRVAASSQFLSTDHKRIVQWSEKPEFLKWSNSQSLLLTRLSLSLYIYIYTRVSQKFCNILLHSSLNKAVQTVVGSIVVVGAQAGCSSLRSYWDLKAVQMNVIWISRGCNQKQLLHERRRFNWWLRCNQIIQEISFGLQEPRELNRSDRT